MLSLLTFFFGVALLVAGAELLVRGAARLAASFAISPLVVGLTVVAFGTSAPELAVSLASSLNGQADIALGNVVGSNIFNVLFILGVSAAITPLVVASQLVRLDLPFMILTSATVLFMARDGMLGRLDGTLLFVALIVYLGVLMRLGRKASDPSETPGTAGAARSRLRERTLDVALIALGLVMLVLGSRVLLEAAITIARDLGVGELIIGLTLVATGTSLPEVATSILAAVRGQREIAVGNVVGSNIFNLLAVLGSAAALSPNGMRVSETALRLDIPVMLAVAVVCLPMFFTGHTVVRWEGLVLVGYYFAYTSYLVLAAQSHQAAAVVGMVTLAVAVPLTVFTLAVATVRSLREVPAP